MAIESNNPAPTNAEKAALLRDENGLFLAGNGMELHPSYDHMRARLRPGNLARELLVRAAKTKRADGATPRALDATAGLGEDALLLAAAGFAVELYERDPIIAALAREAIAHGCETPDLAQACARMTLLEGDSIAALRALAEQDAPGEPPDVVLLDPMFPARRKNASVKKKFQLLHELEQPCQDEEALLEAALASGARKVVVKRPVKGPYLAGRKPDYTLEGKAIRYDCFARA